MDSPPQLKAQAAASRPKVHARPGGARRAVERKRNQSNLGKATFSIDAITRYPEQNSATIITEKIAAGINWYASRAYPPLNGCRCETPRPSCRFGRTPPL